MDIEQQKLLYHITDIENLGNIIDIGLVSRAKLSSFVDVADQDILKSRQNLQLENYVPFHFFAGNPFDGRIQLDNPDREFVIIAVYRQFAANNSWKVIPEHPLANSEIQLLEYGEGMAAIDWNNMNKRDYSDEISKSVCMAECLSPTIVKPTSFQSIFVKSEASKKVVDALLQQHNLAMYVNINNKMFK